jgi:gliding motility-associated-like protein
MHIHKTMKSFKNNTGAEALFFTINMLILLFPLSFLRSQNVVNNGSNIVIGSGIYMMIDRNFINLSSGRDGKVDIDGTMIIKGDWINNALTPVFTNIESSPDGTVVLDGANPQIIGGTSPTSFENLSLIRSRKTIQKTNCIINGILSINAILDLNKNKLILNNNSTSAINYISKYILSESAPSQGYSEIQWNIGNSLGTYNIPFGSGLSIDADLNLSLSTISSGNPSTGNISFATYPTDCFNYEFPSNVFDLNYDVSAVVDRYWIINPDYAINKPDIDIAFQYNSDDIDNCNDKVIQQNLKAIRYNTSLMTWDDINPSGVDNKSSKTVTVSGILQNNFYAPWTLFSENPVINIYIPNSFTPDGDGLNDNFTAVGDGLEKYEFHMYIFDRWGEIIYQTNDIYIPWDGTVAKSGRDAPLGVYAYLVNLVNEKGKDYSFSGSVTLLR